MQKDFCLSIYTKKKKSQAFSRQAIRHRPKTTSNLDQKIPKSVRRHWEKTMPNFGLKLP